MSSFSIINIEKLIKTLMFFCIFLMIFCKNLFSLAIRHGKVFKNFDSQEFSKTRYSNAEETAHSLAEKIDKNFDRVDVGDNRLKSGRFELMGLIKKFILTNYSQKNLVKGFSLEQSLETIQKEINKELPQEDLKKNDSQEKLSLLEGINSLQKKIEDSFDITDGDFNKEIMHSVNKEILSLIQEFPHSFDPKTDESIKMSYYLCSRGGNPQTMVQLILKIFETYHVENIGLEKSVFVREKLAIAREKAQDFVQYRSEIFDETDHNKSGRVIDIEPRPFSEMLLTIEHDFKQCLETVYQTQVKSVETNIQESIDCFDWQDVSIDLEYYHKLSVLFTKVFESGRPSLMEIFIQKISKILGLYVPEECYSDFKIFVLYYTKYIPNSFDRNDCCGKILKGERKILRDLLEEMIVHPIFIPAVFETDSCSYKAIDSDEKKYCADLLGAKQAVFFFIRYISNVEEESYQEKFSIFEIRLAFETFLKYRAKRPMMWIVFNRCLEKLFSLPNSREILLTLKERETFANMIMDISLMRAKLLSTDKKSGIDGRFETLKSFLNHTVNSSS